MQLSMLHGLLACVSLGSIIVVPIARADDQLATLKSDYFASQAPLRTNPYSELPLGAIVPDGYLRHQLELMAQGMTGNLDALYPQVLGERNGWLGGDGDGWERGPYWIDGLLPLAYLLDDEQLKAKVQPWIEWTLANQREDGYLGPLPFENKPTPEPGIQKTPREDWWPKIVMLKVLQNYYTATRDDRVIAALDRYFRYQLRELPKTPLGHWTFWGEQRGGDNLMVVLWLYNITGEDYLLDLARLIHRQTYPHTEQFLKADSPLTRQQSLHCVNIAQGMKHPAIYFQLDGDKQHLEAIDKALADLDQHFGLPTGLYGADEPLNSNSPTTGSEFCTAAEMMYSLEKIIEITGDVRFADRLERIAFNVLPTQATDDFGGKQYYSLVNQVVCARRDEPAHLTDHDGTDNVYGVLTGYPCCTTNFHQCWPKLAQHLWMASADDGLAALVYAPCTVTARVADGQTVSVQEETNYPFDETIRFRISTSQPVKFPLHVRIPSWCEQATITINGNPHSTEAGDQIVKLSRPWQDRDVVELTLPMRLAQQRWYRGAATIERGPLVYALRIGEKWQQMEATDAYGDYRECHPTDPWNYGLIESHLNDLDKHFKVQKRETLAENPWNIVNAPLEIHALGYRLPQWKLVNQTAGPIPQSPAAAPEGKPEPIRLIPYGCTTLRIAEFPVVQEESRSGITDNRPPESQKPPSRNTSDAAISNSPTVREKPCGDETDGSRSTAGNPMPATVSLRAPAVPLIAHDPYFSIWSQYDCLTDGDTTHWTGKPHRLASLVRIDGQARRVMGSQPSNVPAMKQTDLSVLPTRTVYAFESAGVELTLTFLTPALPEDLDVLARPVTYLTYEFRATDGKTHDVQLYLDGSAELAVNTPDQQVQGALEEHGNLVAIKIGSTEQAVLAKRGDDLRIDWGYLYVAALKSDEPTRALAARKSLQQGFVASGPSSLKEKSAELPAAADEIAAGIAIELGDVSNRPVSRSVMLAYDDLFSIQYMKKNLRPYWRRGGWEAADLLQAAAGDFTALRERCEAFDRELMADLTRAGGAKYAALSALAYRQCFAAGKFVADDNGQPLQFCKENHSNGCIGTSDVFYPMAPQFLLFSPTLTKSFLVPFMNYAASPRWKFPFAPHDLGTYPHANGQRYGGGERSEENQMPVEESGNLLLLMAAVAQIEGNADFAGLYWTQLEQWAEFLKDKGFNPENQLCTDDFAGHLAHNVNLSAKAICALGAFAKLCEMRGEAARADEYRKLAKTFAARWVEQADDGDHFRLAFDRPNTWSQKYNLVWDRLLGLELFPAEVLRKEMDYYREVQNRYGLPLDNRETYTKLDWVLWTATLTQERADFEALVEPVFDFLNESPDRSPMTDWYFTDNGRKRGFTARPVVGGVFLQMLYDRPLWAKYAGRDKTRAAGWAPMPIPPRTETLLPTSEHEPAMWRYTTQRPSINWFAPEFDDQSWKQGPAGFGTHGTPGAVVRTEWKVRDIWLRRSFELSDPLPGQVALRLHHDEDAEVYLNGVRVLTRSGYSTDYELEDIDAQVLRPGRNIIAIHCRQTRGGQYIDAGLVAIVPATPIANN